MNYTYLKITWGNIQTVREHESIILFFCLSICLHLPRKPRNGFELKTKFFHCIAAVRLDPTYSTYLIYFEKIF